MESITFDNCIAWDRGSAKVYYIDKTNCKEIRITNCGNNPDSFHELCEFTGTGANPVAFQRGFNVIDTQGNTRSILTESGNSTALVGDYRKLPNGINYCTLDAAALTLFNIKPYVTYGPSGNRGFVLLFKEGTYGGFLLMMVICGGALTRGVFYKEVRNTLADSDSIGDWDVLEFPTRFTSLSDLLTNATGSRLGYGFLHEKFFHYPNSSDALSVRDALGHELTDYQFITRLSSLPTLTQPGNSYNGGKILYVKDIKKLIAYDNTDQKWYEADGVEAGTLRSGATADRPTGIPTGFCYLDTTLNKPIWYTGSGWVDATGASV